MTISVATAATRTAWRRCPPLVFTSRPSGTRCRGRSRCAPCFRPAWRAPADVDVDGVRSDGVGLVVPDLGGDHATGQDARGPAKQELDERRLDCRQGDRIPRHGHLASGRIEAQVGALEHRSRRERRAALEGMDTGNQLVEVERLDQVVVGTSVEAGDPVRRGVAGGEHEDRCAVAAVPRLGNDLDPRALRHAPVQHRHVVVVGAQVPERRLTVCHCVDDVAVLPQPRSRTDRNAASSSATRTLIVPPNRRVTWLQARGSLRRLALGRCHRFLQVRAVRCVDRDALD